jgi:hypothetical protein
MTTTTINASGSERMFRAATVVALLIAIAALTLAFLNRPGHVTASGASASVAQEKSVAGLVPGGSVYENQVPASQPKSVTALLPGGSVYKSQVPAGQEKSTAGLVPGGSVYGSQVPGYGYSPREHNRQVNP